VVEPRFLWAQDFSEGLARVQVSGSAAESHDGRWGYIDTGGKWVLPPVYTSASPFSEGFVRTEEGRYGYIDRTGTFVWKRTFLNDQKKKR